MRRPRVSSSCLPFTSLPAAAALDASAEAQDQFTQFLVAVLSQLAVFVGGQLMRDYGVAALEPTRQLLRVRQGRQGPISDAQHHVRLKRDKALCAWRYIDPIKVRQGRQDPISDAQHHVRLKRDKALCAWRYIDPIKGRGVFALEPIRKGSFILEYRGVLEKTEKTATWNEYTYIFKHKGTEYCLYHCMAYILLSLQRQKTKDFGVMYALCFLLFSLYFNQNESDFSEEEASDDVCDPEYVPGSESDTEDEEPIKGLANSTCQVAEESLMDTSMNCTVPDDTLDIGQSCTNTVPSTSVVRAGQNFCFICKDFHFKIARHFKTHIKDNSDIAYALSLPAGSATRKKLLENLRNRGNFEYNRDVLKKGSGQLKVKRKAKKVECKKYEYCIHCKGMFLRPELWRHMKRCSSKAEEQEHQGRKRVLGLASAIQSACSSTVNDGVLKMLSRMHDDDIASVIRNDFCLLRYADTLFRKHGHDPSKHDYIRQKIRQLGRFLQTIRKRSSILTLEDAIKPGNFMEVIEAVKETAGFDKDKNCYKTPSLALKIGHSLLKVSDIIHCHALMAGDDNLIKSSKAFQKLYTAKWSEYISHCALSTISDLKYNKAAKLPLTDDVTKFNKHLDKTAESATAALTKDTTVQNYSSLAKAALTKIVLFNRRHVTDDDEDESEEEQTIDKEAEVDCPREPNDPGHFTTMAAFTGFDHS
ncbi:hypothetical protein ABVT39_016899 [Epinephelus coioides]